MTDKLVIDSFRGEYAFLSNFYTSFIRVEGITYPTVEHAFQAEKTLDIGTRQLIASASSAAKAKSYGRAVKLRPDWETVKDEAMLEFLRLKFCRDSPLASRLIATHPTKLVEGNTWGDTYWGVCKGRGQNKLGILLMQVRDELLK